MPISDELLDKLGDFYTSAFVENHMPWIRKITFAEWVERQVRGGENDARTLRQTS